MAKLVYFALVATSLCFTYAYAGHDFAHLVEPPPRGSLPGGKLPEPEAYEEKHPQQLDCGGFETQWTDNNGACGVCGDAYGGSRDHEDGGALDESPVKRVYTAGSIVKTKVLNGEHDEGWMEFRLCVRDTKSVPVTASCMEEHVLQLADGSGSRFHVTKQMSRLKVFLEIPDDVVCDACVFQWYYHTELRRGTDDEGRTCMGCGPQVEFYNCADVVIQPKTMLMSMREEPENYEDDDDSTDIIGMPPAPAQSDIETTGNRASSSSASAPVADPASSQSCYAIGKWAEKGAKMDAWCREKCAFGPEYCPDQICKC